MAIDQNARPSSDEGHKDVTRTATPEPGQQARIRVDDAKLTSAYANFCCVRTTPEELLIDFGVNVPAGRGDGPIRLDQRMILSHATAKRLLGALNAAITRHETTLGAGDRKAA